MLPALPTRSETSRNGQTRSSKLRSATFAYVEASRLFSITEADSPSLLLQQDGLLPNYFDNESSFSDAAGSALLSATAFRLAALDSTSSTDYSSIIRSASTIRTAVNSHVGSSGWLSQVVVSFSLLPLKVCSSERSLTLSLRSTPFRIPYRSHKKRKQALKVKLSFSCFKLHGETFKLRSKLKSSPVPPLFGLKTPSLAVFYTAPFIGTS